MAPLVPFVDLKAQYQSIKPEIDSAIAGVLENSQFILGTEVAKFEEEFALYCQAREAVGVNSGTSALHLALLAAGVGPGDEVITVPFTFVATAAAIVYTGAKPVFVDVAPDSLTINTGQIEQAVSSRTKAIIPVHLFGQPADMDPVLDIARRHNLVVIEDAAQAHGAEYKGRRVGSIGDVGCFSFYPSKNLGAYGEGGMVVSNNPTISNQVRTLRDWGIERKYYHEIKGFNYRMEGIQGAILRVKLRYLDTWTMARRQHAQTYNELLSNTAVTLPTELPYAKHVYHIYAVRALYRDSLHAALRADGIEAGIHYPVPVHLQKAYADLGLRAGDFPRAEEAAKEIISLPMYPELSLDQQRLVSEALLRGTLSSATNEAQ